MHKSRLDMEVGLKKGEGTMNRLSRRDTSDRGWEIESKPIVVSKGLRF